MIQGFAEFNIRMDGFITNSDMYGYPASHFSLPMEAVERIELVRGLRGRLRPETFGSSFHDQVSQEFRFNTGFGDFADITIGAFYFDADTTMDARVDLGYVDFDFLHGPDPVDDRHYAVFANGIFRLTDRLELAAGLRYSDDKKVYRYARRNADFSPIEPCIGPPGTPGNPPNCLISSLNGTVGVFEDDRVDIRAALS